MQPAADPAERTYEAFAPFYDRFTAGSDYEAWTTHVEELLLAHAPRGRRLLDAACGTGKSLLPFLERGYQVVGCDISAAMLELARAKAPHVELHRADLRTLPALDRFDVVTCFDDSLNYLRSASDLGAAFESVTRNLARGGLFVFDLNTLLAYRTTFASDQVSGDPELRFTWRGRCSSKAPPGCLAEASIEVFRGGGAGPCERVETRHVQRHHPSEHVLELLDRAGLECLALRGVRDDGSRAHEPDEATYLKSLYVTRLAEGR